MINKVIFDGTAEQGIESDLMLADYCPDVVKILRCCVNPKIEATTVSGSKITIDAVAQIKIYYLTEQKTIRQHSLSIPFQKQCDFKEPVTGSPIAYVHPKLDYINCRAISPRRLELRGAVSMEIKVLCVSNEEAVCEADELGVQLKKDIVQSNQLSGQVNSTFTVQETLELGYGKPSIATVLDFRTEATVSDCKPIANKVITKGDLHLDLLYYCSEGKLQKMEYSIPISQIADMEGAAENSECFVCYEVINTTLEPKANLDGEIRNLMLECKVKCTVQSHSKQSYVHISDCYSTQHECSCVGKKSEAAELIQNVENIYSYKQSINVPETVGEIGDLWCSIEDVTVTKEEKKILLGVKLSICMIAFDTDKVPELFERTEEFTHEIAVDKNTSNMMFLPIAFPVSVSHSVLAPDRMEIRCDIMIKGCIYNIEPLNIIKAIEVDTSKQKEIKNRPALTIYYADKGESIWEIAKHYNTLMDGIIENNSLQDEILSDRCMLLIPMV
ncbi:MAG: DUF3794 domain-containing protein [Oscillospiraceae bacterium]